MLDASCRSASQGMALACTVMTKVTQTSTLLANSIEMIRNLKPPGEPTSGRGDDEVFPEGRAKAVGAIGEVTVGQRCSRDVAHLLEAGLAG